MLELLVKQDVQTLDVAVHDDWLARVQKVEAAGDFLREAPLCFFGLRHLALVKYLAEQQHIKLSQIQM